MKKQLLSFAALFAAVFTLQSCTVEGLGSRLTNGTDVESLEFSNEEKKGNMISRTYDIKDFNGLRSELGIGVVYKQANNYEVRFEGTEKAFDNLVVNVVDGKLYVGRKRTRLFGGNTSITLYLTAPSLNTIINDGALTFKFSSFKADDMKIDNDGSLKLEGELIECKNFEFESDGASSFATDIRSKEDLKVGIDGSAKINGRFTAANNIMFSIDGSGKLNCDVKSKFVKVNIDGSGSLIQNVEAESFLLNSDGACSADINFKGKKLQIDNDGSGSIKIDCDCEEFIAKNDGFANIKVKGTADRTDVKSDGISKIDITELNKF